MLPSGRTAGCAVVRMPFTSSLKSTRSCVSRSDMRTCTTTPACQINSLCDASTGRCCAQADRAAAWVSKWHLESLTICHRHPAHQVGASHRLCQRQGPAVWKRQHRDVAVISEACTEAIHLLANFGADLEPMKALNSHHTL